LAKAREEADSIACINNLKQMGLSVKVWAVDNHGAAPPDMLCLSNELSTPKTLVCPADKTRAAAKDWGSYTAANCSYEYMAPAALNTEPSQVMFRCPIHGHKGLCDGSVQRLASVVTRVQRGPTPPSSNPAPLNLSPKGSKP
jgi:hypothetical protein